jgi:hypothetical protein
MKLIKIFILFVAVSSLTACKKYLEEEPKKQASIQSIEQLEALLNNASVATTAEDDITEAYSTDNAEITPDLYKNNSSRFVVDNLYYYTFQTDILANGISADALWNSQYSNIYTANLILFNVDEVSGDETKKAIVKADAHFLRAYSYWVLVNHYCNHYVPGTNDNDPGLPLKTTIDYEESLNRSMLKEVYDLISRDIEEAQKTPINDVQDKLRWRLSKKAISAFLSRFYLFLGDYTKCIQYADDALGSQTVQIVDFKTLLPGITENYTNPSATLNYCELNNWTDAKYLYWKELYFARYTTTRSQWRIPSSSLLALYDQSNDLRYKYFMIPNGGRRLGVANPATYRYTMFNDGRTAASGPTIAEVFLNKAEAQARKNDFANAIQTVNLLRAKRMNTAAPLSATTQDEAIRAVLEERRREMPFVTRWYDIRRFAANNYAADNVTVTHNFFKVIQGAVDVNTPQVYTLPVGSKRYAIPINGVEISASRGQISQNQY